MNEELPLRDIHLPDSTLWWPLAPGWWILAVLMLLLIIALVVFGPRLWRWLRDKPVRSLALKEIQRIKQDFNNEADTRRALSEISILLRRSAMSLSGRAESASLTGENWVAELNKLCGYDCFSSKQSELLAYGLYKPQIESNLEGLLNSCERWIRSLPKRGCDVTD